MQNILNAVNYAVKSKNLDLAFKILKDTDDNLPLLIKVKEFYSDSKFLSENGYDEHIVNLFKRDLLFLMASQYPEIYNIPSN